MKTKELELTMLILIKSKIKEISKTFSKTLDNLKFWLCKTFGSNAVSICIEAKKLNDNPKVYGTEGVDYHYETDRDGSRQIVWKELGENFRKTWNDRYRVTASHQMNYSGFDDVDEAKKYIFEHWWELKHFDIVRVIVKQYGRKAINLSGTVKSVKLMLIENKTFSESLKWDKFL